MQSDYSQRSRRRHQRKELDGHLASIHVQKSNRLKFNANYLSELTEQEETSISVNNSIVSNYSDSLVSSESGSLLSNISATSSILSSGSSYNGKNEVQNDSRFSETLGRWAVKYNIKHNALRGLLTILKPQVGVLPSDPRTLLSTPRKLDVISISGGSLVYFGIASKIATKLKTLAKFFREDDSPVGRSLQSKAKYPLVSISVGIDGIPITKSNTKSFWPVLGKIDQLSFDNVFVIGLFQGNSKPSDTHFLDKFILEVNELEKNGIQIGQSLYSFKVSKICADAPARSFLKNVNNHNGYSSCERCVQVGQWLGRMVFLEFDCDARTDLSIKLLTDKRHHKKNGVCTLNGIDIGLVSQVPLDYMHLVCLGVTRKLFRQWVKGKIPHKLSNKIVMEMSKHLLLFRKYIPNNFQRKPRGLLEIDHFKASEFRTLLLYTGVVCLKNLLSQQYYNHFLLLHSAMFILLSKKAFIPEWNSIAKTLLRKFVEDGIKIYGSEFSVYNVHSLLHLHDDAMRFGSLDNASCFPFENFMQEIKRMIHSKNFALEQVTKRIAEYEMFTSPDNLTCRDNQDFKVSDRVGSNCYMLASGKLILVKQVLKRTFRECVVECSEFLSLKNVKNYPIRSSSLGIYLVSNVSSFFKLSLNLNEIACQCIILPTYCKPINYFCFPLLHTIK